MDVSLTRIVAEFVTIWVVVDPIGTVPVFIAATAGHAAATRRRIAIEAIAFATGILLFFIVAGQLLLDALAIPLPSFQIAGGIVLFLFALTMIFGPSKPEAERKDIAAPGHEVAVFPLAVPSIASPGAMLAVVILTDNHRYSIAEQTVTTAVMIAIMLITLALLLLAGPILRVIGAAGASIVSRVMGLILASVAVHNVLEAISEHFGLAT